MAGSRSRRSRRASGGAGTGGGTQRSRAHREQHKLGRASTRNASWGVGGRVQGCRQREPHVQRTRRRGGGWLRRQRQLGRRCKAPPWHHPPTCQRRPDRRKQQQDPHGANCRRGGLLRVPSSLPPAFRLREQWPAGDRSALQPDQRRAEEAGLRRAAAGTSGDANFTLTLARPGLVWTAKSNGSAEGDAVRLWMGRMSAFTALPRVSGSSPARRPSAMATIRAALNCSRRDSCSPEGGVRGPMRMVSQRRRCRRHGRRSGTRATAGERRQPSAQPADPATWLAEYSTMQLWRARRYTPAYVFLGTQHQ